MDEALIGFSLSKEAGRMCEIAVLVNVIYSQKCQVQKRTVLDNHVVPEAAASTGAAYTS
jgi:hypothetical protein